MGITSWGEGCGKAYRPGVYARTEYFLPWIHNKLNKVKLLIIILCLLILVYKLTNI